MGITMLALILLRILYILLLAIGEGQAGQKPNTFWSKRSQEYLPHLPVDKPVPSLPQISSEEFNKFEFNHFPFSTIIRGKERTRREHLYIKPVLKKALPPYLMPFSTLVRLWT